MIYGSVFSAKTTQVKPVNCRNHLVRNKNHPHRGALRATGWEVLHRFQKVHDPRFKAPKDDLKEVIKPEVTNTSIPNGNLISSLGVMEHGLCSSHHQKAILPILRLKLSLLKFHHMSQAGTFINLLYKLLHGLLVALNFTLNLSKAVESTSELEPVSQVGSLLTRPHVVFRTQPFRP